MVLTDSTGVVLLTATFAQPQPGQAQPSVPGAVVPGGGPAATGTLGTPPPQQPTGQPQGGAFPPFFWILILGMLLMIVLTSRSGRKQKKERETMLSSLKRNDRVQTVGGIIGTVVELNDTEMVLRVDEVANTRIRFSRAATQQILREAKDTARAGDLEVKPKPEATPAR